MKFIDRTQFIAEQLIREHVSQRIIKALEEQQKNEKMLRREIRKLLEAETGTTEPSDYTGINVLANVLEKIIPVIQDDYKMLTTSPEQRDSFRNHIIHAIKNSLRPLESAESAGSEDLPESYLFDLDLDVLLEKMVVDLTPEEDEMDDVEGEFIDIDAGTEEEEFVQIEDQNETGRNFASDTYKKVEKQIVDAYDMLADEEDQTLFYDYMLTNMLLYFDKFEDELQPTLPDTTTPEYEEEKDKDEATDLEADEATDVSAEAEASGAEAASSKEVPLD